MRDQVELAVAGAHLSGMPLNRELTERGATLLKTCRTSGDYALFALAGTTPAKPGLVRRPGFAGQGIVVEVWSLSVAAFGAFVASLPPPMTIGSVTLEDGSTVRGFCCEPYALENSKDITEHGGWQHYLASLAKAP